MGCPRHLKWSPVKGESVDLSPRWGLKGKRQRKGGLSSFFGLLSFLAHSLFYGLTFRKCSCSFVLSEGCIGRWIVSRKSSSSSPTLLRHLHALSSIVL